MKLTRNFTLQIEEMVVGIIRGDIFAIEDVSMELGFMLTQNELNIMESILNKGDVSRVILANVFIYNMIVFFMDKRTSFEWTYVLNKTLDNSKSHLENNSIIRCEKFCIDNPQYIGIFFKYIGDRIEFGTFVDRLNSLIFRIECALDCIKKKLNNELTNANMHYLANMQKEIRTILKAMCGNDNIYDELMIDLLEINRTRYIISKEVVEFRS